MVGVTRLKKRVRVSVRAKLKEFHFQRWHAVFAQSSQSEQIHRILGGIVPTTATLRSDATAPAASSDKNVTTTCCAHALLDVRALRYLAPYVFRVAISNSRIVKVEPGPDGFQKVRHFGFAHPQTKTNWEWLAMLVTVTLTMVYVLTVWASLPPAKRVMRCPECGGELTCLGFVPSTTRRLAEFEPS